MDYPRNAKKWSCTVQISVAVEHENVCLIRVFRLALGHTTEALRNKVQTKYVAIEDEAFFHLFIYSFMYLCVYETTERFRFISVENRKVRIDTEV